MHASANERRSARAVCLLSIVIALCAVTAWPAVPGTAGCGAVPSKSGTYTISHAGIVRSYRLSMPSNYDAARPTRVVLVFHGWGGDESEFLSDPTVVAESNRRGYVVVAPRGVGFGSPDNRKNSWTFRGSATGIVATGTTRISICDTSTTPDYTYPSCKGDRALNTCSWTQCQDDDVQFVRTLIEHLKSTLCIDTRHVFAVGGSNGGMFTWELAANPTTASLFRAIAPIIGLPHRGDVRSSPVRGGLPVILITGTSDDVVPPGHWDDTSYTTSSNNHDRFYYTGATAVIRHWSAAAGCPLGDREEPVSTGYPLADCRTYCPTQNGAWPRVLDCRAHMGHDYQLSWSWKLVMDFFDRL
jgi:poly(3-hydroxybutyrate) depolymerase